MIMGRPLPSELRDQASADRAALVLANSGEVACGRSGSIGRLLRKHDRDWHDFADHVVADRAVAPLPQGQARRRPRPGAPIQADGRSMPRSSSASSRRSASRAFGCRPTRANSSTASSAGPSPIRA